MTQSDKKTILREQIKFKLRNVMCHVYFEHKITAHQGVILEQIYSEFEKKIDKLDFNLLE